MIFKLLGTEYYYKIPFYFFHDCFYILRGKEGIPRILEKASPFHHSQQNCLKSLSISIDLNLFSRFQGFHMGAAECLLIFDFKFFKHTYVYI